MTNVAHMMHPHGEVTQEVGRVETAGALVVQTDSGRYEARRAVSCLVAPTAVDVVVVSLLSDGRCFVLAVLERPGEGAGVTLEADGDVTVRPGGRFAIASQEGVTIASGGDVSVASASVSVKTVEASLAADKLGVVGRYLHREIDRIKTVAGVIDDVAERISQRVQRLYRRTEDFEQVRAGKIDMVAEQTMSLRGKNTLMTSEELVKVDGEQIHLG